MNDPTSVLVITGAAATGKSTLGDHLRGGDGLVVIDGDVLGRGASATAEGRRDYVGFWRYVLAICGEVRTNGLVPVVPRICLPEQVLVAVDDEVVHFLALLSEPAPYAAASPRAPTSRTSRRRSPTSISTAGCAGWRACPPRTPGRPMT